MPDDSSSQGSEVEEVVVIVPEESTATSTASASTGDGTSSSDSGSVTEEVIDVILDPLGSSGSPDATPKPWKKWWWLRKSLWIRIRAGLGLRQTRPIQQTPARQERRQTRPIRVERERQLTRQIQAGQGLRLIRPIQPIRAGSSTGVAEPGGTDPGSPEGILRVLRRPTMGRASAAGTSPDDGPGLGGGYSPDASSVSDDGPGGSGYPGGDGGLSRRMRPILEERPIQLRIRIRRARRSNRG